MQQTPGNRAVNPPEATPTQGTPVGGYDVRTGRSSSRHSWRWLWTLLGGAGLWVLSMIVTAITQNTNLLPSDILIGSFLVPVSAVVWNFDHRADTFLPMTRIFYAFVVGGTLGVLGASVLEAFLVPQNGLIGPFVVGLIEEAVKFGALVLVAQRLRRYTTTDGLVLGATVGFGFAALESSGYAFNSLLTTHGLSLGGLLETVIERAVLAPLGHGLWTAVLGAFLFHASEKRNRLRLSWPLVGMYFVVVALHGLWDSSSTIALLFVGFGQTRLSEMQQAVAFILSLVVTLIVGGIGVVVLALSWNGLVRLPRLRAQGAAARPGQGAAWQQQPPPGWGYRSVPPPQQPSNWSQPPAWAPPQGWGGPPQAQPGPAQPPPSAPAPPGWGPPPQSGQPQQQQPPPPPQQPPYPPR